MRRQPSPVVARYLLARLRPLTRPIFWGPSIALMLLILFTWQYWMRPEWVSYFGGNASYDADNGLSSEDRAIGADIDTLPLLFNDFKLSSDPTSKQPALDQSASATSSTALGSLPNIPIPGSATIAQSQPSNLSGSGNFGNVFSGTMQQFGLPVNGLTGDSTLGGSSSLPSTQPQAPNNLLGVPTGSASTDPVQTATNGSLPEASATSANNRPLQTPYSFTSSAPAAPIEGTTSLGEFGVNAAPTLNPYTNSYTSIVGGAQPPSPTAVPGVVAPSIAPISPSLGQSSLSPQPLNSSSLNSTSSLTPQQSQIPINDAPFTAPRPIPGRVLGGGEINTFSNP